MTELKKVEFKDLKIGDPIGFSNKYSKCLGGAVHGTIVKKIEYGIILNIFDGTSFQLYFSHEQGNEYWKLPKK